MKNNETIEQVENCILCGTEIQDRFCFECDDTAQEMGLDYNSLTEWL